jgi:hypothetical protein
MSWAWIIGTGAIVASLYWLVMVGYRLFLSLKGLQAAGVPLKASLDLLAQPLERDYTAARNTTASDLGEVLAKREQRKRAKRDFEEARRRRLIERLNQMNLDKR